ncbi:SsrA-binding protein SmpB [Sodalis sp. CWE]|uniref:SsrA-binding protein SmpB n=1 Tax=Sodalis sp. CWE TaxID=2803816 RepID=UPI001C7D6845|nr:SsrA-binding protein SmpB [Sodalis sp. CWE]MBX4181132.1 SsrA-binding protein SmpB [Sodalis sp. CWE]
MKKKKKSTEIIITQNKRAKHEFYIEKELEAGLVLLGWEVKSLRSGQVNISNSYVLIKHREVYLFGAVFQPLIVSTSHEVFDPARTRKILLKKHEINFLFNCINRKRYTAIALSLFWKSSWAKMKIGVAMGKKKYDKRIKIKEREWQINKKRTTDYLS